MEVAPGAPDGAIEARQIGFRYGVAERWIVDEASFRIEPGEFVAITGRSGGARLR